VTDLELRSVDFDSSGLCPVDLSYPVLRPKPSTHSMCAQKSSLHTYHTENGYRITNVTI
jgi:hypothetical protein